MEVSTDAAAACHCLSLFAGAKMVREQEVSGRVVATLLSLQNRHKERRMPHRKEQRRKRERNVSGGMLDVILFQ